MRIPLWERLRDQSSLAISRRRAKGVAFVALFGTAALSGAASWREHVARAPLTLPDVRAAIPVPTPPIPIRTASLEMTDPAQAGLDPSRLSDAVAAVRSEVRRGALPGGTLAVGKGRDLVLLKGIGTVDWEHPVDPENTVYDLASLTKVVATTTAVMLLVEDGKMELDAPVQRYYPEFSGGSKALVTVRQLLTHTSGLPDGVDVDGLSPDEAMRKILHTPLKRAPGKQVVYSDLGFVVLYAAAERVAGEPIPDLLQRRVFGPLGMTSTGYLPGDGCERCAPTLVERNGNFLRGVVHDPTSRALGGIAGNAGLFSTAPDLARFAAMLANGGELDGVRVLNAETIRRFTKRQPGAKTRALGWDTPERNGTGAAGRKISPHAFGHTGYTGTSLWVDPDRGTWTILLTNRTFWPRAPNRIQALRRTVHDEVALSATADSADRAENGD